MKSIVGGLFIAAMAIDPVGYSAQPSQMGGTSWIVVPGQSSAELGKNGALIVNSTVVNIGDSSNYLITFWEIEQNTYRCIEIVGPGPVFSNVNCALPR